jgi:hypothetical protein
MESSAIFLPLSAIHSALKMNGVFGDAENGRVGTSPALLETIGVISSRMGLTRAVARIEK